MRGYWYIIGATLIAVGLIGGIGLFVGGLMPVLQRPTSQFDANGSSTTRFGSGDSMIIYVADVEPVPKLTQNTRCVARDENNNEATVSRYDSTLSINQWHALYVVRAHQAGNYTVSCAGYSDITYGLGPRAGRGAITAVLLGPSAASHSSAPASSCSLSPRYGDAKHHQHRSTRTATRTRPRRNSPAISAAGVFAISAASCLRRGSTTGCP